MTPLIIGIIGMVPILLGFFMTQSHRWSQDDTIYDIINFIGSTCLIYYSVIGHAWPFVVLNTVWAAYSLKDILMDLRKDSKKLNR